MVSRDSYRFSVTVGSSPSTVWDPTKIRSRCLVSPRESFASWCRRLLPRRVPLEELRDDRDDVVLVTALREFPDTLRKLRRGDETPSAFVTARAYLRLMIRVDLPGDEDELHGRIGSDKEPFGAELPDERRHNERTQCRTVEELEFVVLHVVFTVQVFVADAGRIEVALALDDEELVCRRLPRDDVDLRPRHRLVVQRDLFRFRDLDLHADTRPEALHLEESGGDDFEGVHGRIVCATMIDLAESRWQV